MCRVEETRLNARDKDEGGSGHLSCQSGEDWIDLCRAVDASEAISRVGLHLHHLLIRYAYKNEERERESRNRPKKRNKRLHLSRLYREIQLCSTAGEKKKGQRDK